jgi:TonB family protein
MVDLIQKRFDFGYSNVDVVEKFWVWMRTGKFVDQSVFENCEPYVDSLHLSFCEFSADFQFDWNAKVATLNRREWDRDFDAFKISSAEWDRRGKHGPQPRRPDKNNYYEWTTAFDAYEARESLTTHIFTKEQVSGDRVIFEAAKNMSAYFWQKINNAKVVHDNDISDIDPEELGPILKKQAETNFTKFVKKFLKDNYDKYTAIEHQGSLVFPNLISLSCPAYIINYSHNDEVYYCIMDGLTGESIAGRKPRDKGKMFKYGGIAAGVIAAVALCVLAFNWHTGSDTPVSGSMPVVTAEAVKPVDQGNDVNLVNDAITRYNTPYELAITCVRNDPDDTNPNGKVALVNCLTDTETQQTSGSGRIEVSNFESVSTLEGGDIAANTNMLRLGFDQPFSVLLKAARSPKLPVIIVYKRYFQNKQITGGIVKPGESVRLDNDAFVIDEEKMRSDTSIANGTNDIGIEEPDSLQDIVGKSQAMANKVTVDMNKQCQEYEDAIRNARSRGKKLAAESELDFSSFMKSCRSGKYGPISTELSETKSAPQTRNIPTRGALPIGNPASWVTFNDYPPQALRDKIEGTSVFSVAVNEYGKVSRCQIVSSSGHDELDQATCDLVSRRARFNPAANEQGYRKEGTYSNRVKWQISE